MQRTIFEPEHDAFRAAVRTFVAKEVTPYVDEWEKAGIVDRALFQKAAASGFVGTDIPEEYGGGGVKDFRYNQILSEELQAVGATGVMVGLTMQADVALPYILELANDEQKARWMPGIASGDLILAIAMTEPSVGSDLASMGTSAIRDGDHYVVNGSKTFISNGINADLVITAVKTDPSQRHRGMSVVVIERGMEGFERGRNLEKVGLHSQDTAELFFNDVHVPAENLLGVEGEGFKHLMHNLPQERLSIAVAGVGHAKAALDWTVAYCTDRTAFGQKIGSFQASRFTLAEMRADLEVATHYVDQCVMALNAGRLSADDAAIAKLHCTELQKRMVDRGVQLHGGYGYMLEYPIARAYADARVSTIYGGTNEIMKEIIGRSMGF
jgi:alkylation response protein AidB-like acyl-CoA dehydrogenase